MCVVTRSLFSLCLRSGGFEAKRVDEVVEGLDDSFVELVKLAPDMTDHFRVFRRPWCSKDVRPLAPGAAALILYSGS